VLLVTPVYLYRNGSIAHLWLGFPLATVGIFISWMLHIYLVNRVIIKGGRFFISTFVMLAITTITYLIGRNYHFFLSELSFFIIRAINIIAVNAMIYIFIAYLLLNATKKKLDTENEQLKFANLQTRYELLLN
jgi:hypothetical protein